MEINFNFSKKNVLFISDLHSPYNHPDALAFLKALQNKYEFELIINLGDLGDFHAISFHKSNPNLANAGHELKELQKFSKQLEKLFPNMYIVGSNHGDLPIRKFIDSGLPADMLKDFNNIYGVGKGWKFVGDLYIHNGAQTIYVAHGIHRQAEKVAAARGVHHVCGHYHTQYGLNWVSNPKDLLWGMNTGCLIDKDSLAFEYNKLDLSRPIIGCGGVIGGFPKMFPMLLSRSGRWVKCIP